MTGAGRACERAESARRSMSNCQVVAKPIGYRCSLLKRKQRHRGTPQRALGSPMLVLVMRPRDRVAIAQTTDVPGAEPAQVPSGARSASSCACAAATAPSTVGRQSRSARGMLSTAARTERSGRIAGGARPERSVSARLRTIVRWQISGSRSQTGRLPQEASMRPLRRIAVRTRLALAALGKSIARPTRHAGACDTRCTLRRSVSARSMR